MRYILHNCPYTYLMILMKHALNKYISDSDKKRSLFLEKCFLKDFESGQSTERPIIRGFQDRMILVQGWFHFFFNF